MKAVGILMIVLALVIGIVPQFSDCASQGRQLTLADGRSIPMKCHWTARAELALAVPLLATGVLLMVSKRKETLRFLSALGVILGAGVILLPTALVGVCANPDMICNALMRPFLILTGTLVLALNAFVVIQSFVKKEEAAWAYSH